MSSNTEIIARMDYVMATCVALTKIPLMEEAQPTIVWLNQEAERVVQRVLSQSDSPKQRRSWLRVARRKSDVLRNNLIITEEDSTEPVAEEDGILFVCSIMTQMLEDTATVPGQKVFVQDMLDAAYTLESLVPVRKKQKVNHDNIYPDAQKFLERVYQQHNAV